jgi:hypothetical protein
MIEIPIYVAQKHITRTCEKIKLQELKQLSILCELKNRVSSCVVTT